jgi:hypothetical protein
MLEFCWYRTAISNPLARNLKVKENPPVSPWFVSRTTEIKRRRGNTPAGISPRRLTLHRAPRDGRAARQLVFRRPHFTAAEPDRNARLRIWHATKTYVVNVGRGYALRLKSQTPADIGAHSPISTIAGAFAPQASTVKWPTRALVRL